MNTHPTIDPQRLARKICEVAMRYNGLKEVISNAKFDNPKTKGVDQEAVELIAMYRAVGWVEGWSHCYTGDIEFLSELGWVRFDSLREWRKSPCRVIQVDDNNQASLAQPLDFIVKNHEGKMTTIKHRDMDITTDPEHRFWGSWRRGPLELRPISDLKSELDIPPVGGYTPIHPCHLSDNDIEFVAAYIADGSRKKLKYIDFRVSMPRKMARLAEFGPRACSVDKSIYHEKTKTKLTRFTFDKPSFFEEVFDDSTEYKKLRWSWILGLDSRQLRVFLNACVFWSGAMRGNGAEIRTARKQHADIFVSAAALAGYQAKAYATTNHSGFNVGGELWHVRYAAIQDRNKHIDTDDMVQHDADCDLYCITVPSGKILIRDRSGSVYICGNCAAFVEVVIRKALSLEGATKEQIAKFGVPMQLGVMNSVRAFKKLGILDPVSKAGAGSIWLARHGVTDKGHTGICLSPVQTGLLSTIEANTSKDAVVGDKDREGDWITTKVFPMNKRGSLTTQGVVTVESICKLVNP